MRNSIIVMKIYFACKEYKGVLEKDKYLLGARNRLASLYLLEMLTLLKELINEDLLGDTDNNK